jgi:hypothetical protein
MWYVYIQKQVYFFIYVYIYIYIYIYTYTYVIGSSLKVFCNIIAILLLAVLTYSSPLQ